MGLSVLVVEDEPHIILSLQFILKQAGFDVRVARDGEEAVTEAERDPPALMVLDLMLPGQDGFQVCEAVRANPRLAGMRIVVLTAKSGESDRSRALALGADDFMLKPYSTRELVERVRRLLAAPAAAG
jgi:DNA-binding response OmpR family regulator